MKFLKKYWWVIVIVVLVVLAIMYLPSIQESSFSSDVIKSVASSAGSAAGGVQ